MSDALAPKMRSYADAYPGHEHLRELADKLDAEVDKGPEHWDAKKMIGAWARAHRAWRDVTGEGLL